MTALVSTNPLPFQQIFQSAGAPRVSWVQEGSPDAAALRQCLRLAGFQTQGDLSGVVENFQRAYNTFLPPGAEPLVPDGLAGPKTLDALRQHLAGLAVFGAIQPNRDLAAFLSMQPGAPALNAPRPAPRSAPTSLKEGGPRRCSSNICARSKTARCPGRGPRRRGRRPPAIRTWRRGPGSQRCAGSTHGGRTHGLPQRPSCGAWRAWFRTARSTPGASTRPSKRAASPSGSSPESRLGNSWLAPKDTRSPSSASSMSCPGAAPSAPPPTRPRFGRP